MNLKNLLLLIAIIQLPVSIKSQSLSYDIRLNQIGFLPNSLKLAAIVNANTDSFKVMTSDLQTLVYKGQMLPAAYYSSSGEEVRIADFTLMTQTGTFVVVIDGLGKSVPFVVSDYAYLDLLKASLKYYYFNRASMEITSEFGGVYARPAGHPDTTVIVLPSAATPNRPAGTIISTPGGWYDAGDYNKYIVSSAITVFTLLSAYETYSAFYDTLNLNIPESNNNIPDILDEALWNISWMMTMQDEDGGVYNKTTDANFSAFVMPKEATTTRYVCAKSTAATLDFAAIMAMTARIFRKYDQILADTALAKATRAWQWAKQNPNIAFKNPSASGGYPAVNTGEYGDTGFEDEFTWCASELYITTKDSNYYKEINFDQSFGVPGWPTVASMALLSLTSNKDSLTEIADFSLIKNKFINAVANAKNNVTSSPYRIPGDFYYWAGNNAFANGGRMFMQAFRLTGDAGYYNAALSTLDYLLGKNATTYCFVTGFGTKSPKHPHHRISSADGVVNPVPGMLVCGAGGDGSDCGTSSYPSKYPAKMYLDSECSYITNEVAIGINSGLVFLTGAILSEYQKNFIDSMPRYISISTNRIRLTNKTGLAVKFVIEGNVDWEIIPSEEWISVSATSGSGNAVVLVNSATDNPQDTDRIGKIYIYRQGHLFDSIAVTQNGKHLSFRIEAEDYYEKFGTQNEITADDGGGENVGYIDKDNWLSYILDISYEGVYDVTFRHAGYAGNIDVYLNDSLIQHVAFPKTADWQVWDSYTTEMVFPEGQHIWKLVFNSVGTNLNWYQFVWNRLSKITELSSDAVTIYPNPASRYINISFGSEMKQADVSLFTMEGKILLSKNFTGNANAIIDVSSLSKGLCFLKVKTDKDVIIKTVFIQ